MLRGALGSLPLIGLQSGAIARGTGEIEGPVY